MKAFIDTSALIKRYVEEPGSAEFTSLLNEISSISVAHIYWMEFNAAIVRRVKDRSLTRMQADTILKESHTDLSHFETVPWTEQLEAESLKFIHTFGLRTLDGIQLGSALLSRCDIFVSSDKLLIAAAQRTKFKKIVAV